jgi:glucose-1-phosphatase
VSSESQESPARSRVSDGSRVTNHDSLSSNATPVRVILFDVGGVLVELKGLPTFIEWLDNRHTPEEVWQIWLRSPTVRAFETGRIDATTFARRLIAELQARVEPQQFLDAFAAWPTGLFPGTLAMLERIPRRYVRALLSNSNGLHWPRVMDEMGLRYAVEHHFVSHLTGRIKPDDEAFLHVAATLACAPGEVLFLDDNRMNVEAAQRLGMHAFVARGPLETEQALVRAGIIGPR